MVADLNHGNSEKGIASSSLSSSRIQKQCLDTWVNSAAKVAMPGIVLRFQYGAHPERCYLEPLSSALTISA